MATVIHLVLILLSRSYLLTQCADIDLSPQCKADGTALRANPKVESGLANLTNSLGAYDLPEYSVGKICNPITCLESSDPICDCDWRDETPLKSECLTDSAMFCDVKTDWKFSTKNLVVPRQGFFCIADSCDTADILSFLRWGDNALAFLCQAYGHECTVTSEASCLHEDGTVSSYSSSGATQLPQSTNVDVSADCRSGAVKFESNQDLIAASDELNSPLGVLALSSGYGIGLGSICDPVNCFEDQKPQCNCQWEDSEAFKNQCRLAEGLFCNFTSVWTFQLFTTTVYGQALLCEPGPCNETTNMFAEIRWGDNQLGKECTNYGRNCSVKTSATCVFPDGKVKEYVIKTTESVSTTGAIIGGVLGGVALATLVLGIAYWNCQRIGKKSKSYHAQTNDDFNEVDYAQMNSATGSL